jgi:excisionase family DNA binding protein
MLGKRKVEIIAFERERVVRKPVASACPVCGKQSELLTTKQAAALIQVKTESVCRWLKKGKIHGTRTPGGQYRICKLSLFHSREIVGKAAACRTP